MTSRHFVLNPLVCLIVMTFGDEMDKPLQEKVDKLEVGG